MTIKWICNKCGRKTKTKPLNKNSTCYYCQRGRFYAVNKCVICGKVFKPNHLKVQCCSRKCRDKLVGIKLLGKPHNKKHPQRAEIRTCLVCRKQFRAIKDCNRKKGGRTIKLQKYCSKECWAKRNPPEIKWCIYCGKKFKTYERKRKIYCSQKCRDLDWREKKKGEKSHLWKGGKTKQNQILRSRAEYKEWRNGIFKRDNWQCQNCGTKSKKGKKVYLHAHHLKSVAEYPELIYEVSNGITLCDKCHHLMHNHNF